MRQCGCGHGLRLATPLVRFLICASVRLGKMLFGRVSQCPSAKRKLADLRLLCRQLTWLWSCCCLVGSPPSSQRSPSYMIVSVDEFLIVASFVSLPVRTPLRSSLIFWNGKLAAALDPSETVLIMFGAY